MGRRAWIVLGLLFVAARARTLFVDVLDTDETVFHAVAGRLLDGDALYVDVRDNQPPVVYRFDPAGAVAVAAIVALLWERRGIAAAGHATGMAVPLAVAVGEFAAQGRLEPFVAWTLGAGTSAIGETVEHLWRGLPMLAGFLALHAAP